MIAQQSRKQKIPVQFHYLLIELWGGVGWGEERETGGGECGVNFFFFFYSHILNWEESWELPRLVATNRRPLG